MTYGQLISTQTIGAGGATSIDFNSIPGTYTDLLLVLSSRSTDAVTARTALLSFNGSTASFSERRLYGTGSGSGASDTVVRELSIVPAASATASTFSNAALYIPNYAGSTNKAFSIDSTAENNGATGYDLIYAGLWSNTAAITSISITLDGGNHAQYSTASLYGIK